MTETPLRLRLESRRALTDEIAEFTFGAADGGALPAVEPGAHLSVITPAGMVRPYSIVNADDAGGRYVLAVKREPASRGGSASMHDALVPGDEIAAMEPRNDFPLTEAPDYLLIAGGIGITPILPMARRLAATGRRFRLICCTRSPGATAYAEDLRALGPAVVLHHDAGDPARVYDFWDDFAEPGQAHVFCCGPGPLMEEVRAVSGHWPEGAVHFEEFRPARARPEDRPFTAVLARSGNRRVPVAAGETLLAALRAAGVALPSSCETGTCGTCRCGLLGGTPEHRDRVLRPDEAERFIMPCVSRSRGGEIVLDL